VTQQTGVGQVPNVLRELRAGDLSGEPCLLTGAARTASVTAAADGVLLALSQTEFELHPPSVDGRGYGPSYLPSSSRAFRADRPQRLQSQGADRAGSVARVQSFDTKIEGFWPSEALYTSGDLASLWM
jgi:hypothetical protein